MRRAWSLLAWSGRPTSPRRSPAITCRAGDRGHAGPPDPPPGETVIGKPGVCSSCGRPIRWAVTSANHKPVPLAPDPVPGGNIILIPGVVEQDPLHGPVQMARQLRRDEQPPAGVDRYQPHFASCPFGARHRRSQRPGQPARRTPDLPGAPRRYPPRRGVPGRGRLPRPGPGRAPSRRPPFTPGGGRRRVLPARRAVSAPGDRARADRASALLALRPGRAMPVPRPARQPLAQGRAVGAVAGMTRASHGADAW